MLVRFLIILLLLLLPVFCARKDPEQLFAKAQKCVDSNEIQKAIDLFLQTVVVDSNHYRAYNALGLAYLMRDSLDLAEQALNRALSIKPDFDDARVNLGIVYSEKGDESAAIAAYEKAPRNLVACYNLACVHAKKADTAKALQWLERAFMAGFNKVDFLKEDEDLKPLVSLPQVQELIKKYRMDE